MSSKKKKEKKKKRHAPGSADVDLNIMPFIDVFSILNTFLLMSSVSLAIGLIEVQIPFISTPPENPKEPPRSLEVKVDMEKDKITVNSSWSKPPANPNAEEFEVSERGITNMHKHLLTLKAEDPSADKVQFYTDDDVIWNDMALVLDAIKLRQPGDPSFPVAGESAEDKARNASYLFPKVVLASVILR